MATTWNPSKVGTGISLISNNLVAVMSAVNRNVLAVDGKNAGKWYFEIKTVGTAASQTYVGVGTENTALNSYLGSNAESWAYGWDGSAAYRFHAGFVAYGSQINVGDVIGVAVDIDNGSLEFYKNGTSQGIAYSAGVTGTLYPVAGGSTTTNQLQGCFAANDLTYSPPSGYSAWDSGGTETTVTIDTLRQTTTDTTANIDTLRQVGTTETVSIDTLRETITDATATIDTSRRTKSTISAPIDTSRRRTLPPGTVERISIDLKSGTLADNYSADMLSDKALGTAYSALIYGWPLNFTIRDKTYSPSNGRYSFGGDHDITELLKKYITFSTAATDAATIMAMVAAQLGKSLAINIDSHGVRRMSEQTTVMQVLSSLFGWTSEIPHQFVNVFLRGNTLNVLQRGKESGSYTLINYKPGSLSERRLDTLMDSANWEPKIIGDPDGTYQNGTFSFNGVSITYTDGYVTQVVTSEDITTFGYSADLPDSPDDNKYLLSKSNSKNVANSTVVITTYNYQTYRGIEYLAAEVEQEHMNVNSQYPDVIVRQRVTSYYPMQSGFYGMQSQEKSWQYSYIYVDGHWVQMLDQLVVGPIQTQMAEGRPGGPVTPRQRAGEENTPMVDIARNPISSNHIPATDTATLQRYADGLVWLDGKTEYSARVECYDAHIVDFDQTVTFMGLTWYLQSNSIVMTGQQPHPKQTLDLVRWA